MTWSFSGPGEILFGEGSVRELGRRAAALGTRIFFVTGRDASRALPALESLRESGLKISEFTAGGEPTFELLRSALAEARQFEASTKASGSPENSGLLIVGVGGGSVLDLAKGVGVLLTNPGDPLDYAEVIGAGKPLASPSLPVLAVPTTAGTGSEATKNAVFAEPTRKVKVSLRSLSMFPRLALVDPELCYSLPPATTAYSGMDALTQVLEPFVSVKANPVTDALCAAALAEVYDALRKAICDGYDAEARGTMSRVSLFGGIALGNAGLGAVHGLAGPLGGRIPVPHGAACAITLVPVIRANLRALRERDPEGPALSRYARAARIVTGKEKASPDDLADVLEGLVRDLEIPRLSYWGLQEEDISPLARDAAASNSMKGNPIALSAEETEAVLRETL